MASGPGTGTDPFCAIFSLLSGFALYTVNGAEFRLRSFGPSDLN